MGQVRFVQTTWTSIDHDHQSGSESLPPRCGLFKSSSPNRSRGSACPRCGGPDRGTWPAAPAAPGDAESGGRVPRPYRDRLDVRPVTDTVRTGDLAPLDVGVAVCTAT